MADIRYVRPQYDNKIRSFKPVPASKETLHITAPNRTGGETVPIELFLVSRPTPDRPSQGRPGSTVKHQHFQIQQTNKPVESHQTESGTKPFEFQQTENEKLANVTMSKTSSSSVTNSSVKLCSSSKQKSNREILKNSDRAMDNTLNTQESDSDTENENVNKLPTRPFKFNTHSSSSSNTFANKFMKPSMKKSHSSRCFTDELSNSPQPKSLYQKKTHDSRSFMNIFHSPSQLKDRSKSANSLIDNNNPSLRYDSNTDKIKNCPVMNFYTTFRFVGSEYSLMDIQDEEINQLPEVNSPKGIIESLSKSTIPMVDSKTTSCTLNGTQRDQDDVNFSNKIHVLHVPPNDSVTDSQEKKIKNKTKNSLSNIQSAEEESNKKGIPNNNHNNDTHLQKRILKKSASSFDFDEMPYTSFFASLNKSRNHCLEHRYEHGCGEDGHDDSISPLWGYRRHESPLSRTKSADSFMPSGKKFRQVHPASIDQKTSYSHMQWYTPIVQLNSTITGDVESVGNDSSRMDDYLICRKSNEPKVNISCDRLQMRRGALAQPEQMIISQAMREQLQKDVEKRKTSMVRKVSQFINVQLGLNREEDLI